MQDACPLENKLISFDNVKNKKAIIKHLKKCPLFLKFLYLHYNPFCFPYINNTSSYLIEKDNIKDELHRYYKNFNEILIDILKNKIRLTTYEQFETLKYEVVLKQYLKNGMKNLLIKLNDDNFVKKLQTKVTPPYEENAERNINLDEVNNFLNCHIDIVKKWIHNLRTSRYCENAKNNLCSKYVDKLTSNIDSAFPTGENENENADEVENRENNSTQKCPLPILTLQSIREIHKYRICREILNFIDTEIFPIRRIEEEDEVEMHMGVEENNNRTVENIQEGEYIEKEFLVKDEILSIVIYTTIYLCCKMNIIKRLKNKNFHFKKNLNSSGEKSIFFFLENLNKHDIQNVNIMFFLLHFNDNFVKYFEHIFNCRKGEQGEFSMKDNLFIELGAGKGNTTRWVKFIMNDFVEILKKFLQRTQGGNGRRSYNLDEKAKTEITELVRSCKIEKREFHQTNCLDMKRAQSHAQKERCKIVILEREALRNKKEKKNFFMQMSQEKNENIIRIKADIAHFHFFKFMHFSKNGFVTEKPSSTLIPDIIQFYYYMDVYRKKVRPEGHKNSRQDATDEVKTDEVQNTFRDEEGCAVTNQEDCSEHMEKQLQFQKNQLEEISKQGIVRIMETYLQNNLAILGTYFDVHVNKLISFLTQGNNNLLKFYDSMNDFLKNFNCKKVTFLTKHLCGNGTDLALQMFINNTKNKNMENCFIFAPCCHHKCKVQKILGFNRLKNLNIDKRYLQYVVSHMSGYASCDSPIKKSLGKKVKILVDLVRILYLLDQGLQNVYLVKYVNRSITIENHVLLFFNNQNLDLQNFKHF
ncbi:hypothetical protein, conserved [Plasmodium gonderi]|uniref:tRNA:m(4)X modification enzyme TRM13 n=1 Tax=Plasmodium gonderi TaxID=77519 RepID=A0A1Y1JKX7_PLAGO|nr:hypothetical protein, conserved [Plasmodium gonderi]GAW81073.1 hypothetical protein, conserved [Plasmodium gonderi]